MSRPFTLPFVPLTTPCLLSSSRSTACYCPCSLSSILPPFSVTLSLNLPFAIYCIHFLDISKLTQLNYLINSLSHMSIFIDRSYHEEYDSFPRQRNICSGLVSTSARSCSYRIQFMDTAATAGESSTSGFPFCDSGDI